MEPQDWRVRVDQAIFRAQAEKGPVYGKPVLSVRFRGTAGVVIQQAATVRGVSVASFLRRSGLAMAAAVLDRPYDEIIQHDPRIQLVGYTTAQDATGRLQGPWEIGELR